MDKTHYKLRKIVEKLKSCRGRHTELISVYVTPGYNLDNVVSQLAQEQGTASNIKSKQTRKNVTDALEKIIQHLRMYNNTPENGVALFCGNVSKEEGKQDLKLWAVEPKEPITLKLYRCDQTFVTEPLEEMVSAKHTYGLMAVDNKVATIGLLKGDRHEVLTKLTSGYSGKHRAGGQSHRRFERLIAEESHNFKKRIANHAEELLLPRIKEISGIIIGGPAATKEEFVKGDYLHHELRKKIIAVKDTTYTDESGIRELINASKDVLQEVEASKHKELMDRFMHALVKESGNVAYGKQNVEKALEMGAVEVLLLSENLDEEDINKHVDSAEQIGAQIEIVSTEFEEGHQLWVAFGGMAAILRYNVS